MKELALHILDIVENSTRAGATDIEIKIIEDLQQDKLIVEINDNGRGMDETVLKQALDPFFTTKSVRKVGMGLSLFKHAAQRAGGDMEIESAPGKGTKVRAWFDYSNIDRQPIGDMASTLVTLLTSNEDVDLKYIHVKDDETFVFDSKEIKAVLEGIPFSDPEVIRFVSDMIRERRNLS